MIELADCKPGNIVVLDRPYKPEVPSRQLVHNVESGEMISGYEYRSWKGFMYGIIAHVELGAFEILPQESYLARRAAIVFLYLFNPDTEALYIDWANKMPVRVQYSAEEMTLWKRASDFGFIEKGKE